MSFINVDPCGALNEEVDGKITSLEAVRTTMEAELNSIKAEIQAFGVPTSPAALQNALNTASANTIRAGASQLGVIRNFTGTCLTPITKKTSAALFNITRKVSQGLSDYFTGLGLSESSIGRGLRNFVGITNGANFSGIIGEIDRLIGCMSDQPQLSDCISQLSSYASRINAVTAALFLTDAGIFDQTSFLGSIPALDSQLESNINALTDKIKEVEDEAVENVNNAVASTVGTGQKLSTPATLV